MNQPEQRGQLKPAIHVLHDQVDASCLVQSPQLEAMPEEIESRIDRDQLLLACGKKIPLLSGACVELLTGVRSNMPIMKCAVGEKIVDIPRDTGCNGIIVKELVSEDQYTGDFNCMVLIDSTERKVAIVKITMDTPYLSRQVEAQCLPDAIYDLIIGDLLGARAADDPDPSWEEACAVPS